MTSDPDAERLALAAILLSDAPHADLRVIDLPIEAFTSGLYRHVWQAFQEMHDDRAEINLAAVRFYMSDRWPDQYGDDGSFGVRKLAHQLAELMEGVPRHVYINAAVERIRGLGYRRELAYVAEEFQRRASSPKHEIGDTMLWQQRELRELQDKWGRTGLKGTADGVVQRLERFYKTEADIAVRTGYSKLDGALGEVHPGTVMTVLARPGVGKSNLGLNIMANWLEQGDDWGMMFSSIEMPETLASSRLVRMVEGWTEDEMHEAMKGGQRPRKFLTSASSRLVISDRGGITMSALDEEFKRGETALGRPIRALVIDYLQLMHSANPRLKKYEQIAGVTADLKEFAKRKDAFLVVLSQVGRGEAGGGGYRCPSVQSARDSGTVEENADFMLGMWRPDLKPKSEEYNLLQGKINLRVLKGRNGGLNEQCALDFDDTTLRMTESCLPVRG